MLRRRRLAAVLLLAAVTSGCTHAVLVRPPPPAGPVTAAPVLPPVLPPVPAVPTDVIVQVIAATGAPATLPAIATRQTPISAALNCHVPTSPPATLTNSTTVAFDDPFTPGFECRVLLPAGLAPGSYRAVAVLSVATCTDATATQTITPCPSARGTSAPAFTVVATPAAPTVRLVPPVVPGTLVQVVDAVDALGAHWTLGAPEPAAPAHREVLRDGLATGGWGTEIWLLRGLIYVRGDDDQWWAWTGTTWANIGATRPE
ncbi:MAG: hypothetical protein ABJA98_01780 [Acidobacteriota bacterium]